jgi:hypothetical protein
MVNIPGGNGFNPFREVISSNKNPSMLIARRWMYFSNEMKPPLLDRLVTTTSLRGRDFNCCLPENLWHLSHDFTNGNTSENREGH